MPFKLFGGKKDDLESAFVETAKRLGIEILKMDRLSAEISYGGESSSLGLENLWIDYNKLSKDERPKMLEWYLRSILEGMHPVKERPLAEVARMLLPVVRAPFMLDEGEELPVSKVLFEDILVAYVVIDSPSTKAYIFQKDLDRWGTTFEGVYETALGNLRRRTSREHMRSNEEMPGMLFYITDSSPEAYEASRVLLLKELVDPWPEAGVFVSLPARNHMFCVPFTSPEALKAVQAIVPITLGVYGEDSHKISRDVFRFDGTTFERLPIVMEKGVPKVIVGESVSKALTTMIEKEKGGGKVKS